MNTPCPDGALGELYAPVVEVPEEPEGTTVGPVFAGVEAARATLVAVAEGAVVVEEGAEGAVAEAVTVAVSAGAVVFAVEGVVEAGAVLCATTETANIEVNILRNFIMFKNFNK